jgi:putative cofactor-binding repeat protein
MSVTGALSVRIGQKSLNTKTDNSNAGSGAIGGTFLRFSTVSIDGNIIRLTYVRLLTSATTFGSTANGGGISLCMGSSGFTRVSSQSVMGSTDVSNSSVSVTNNTLFRSNAIGKISFGRSNGADVRGGGVSFFVGYTATAFVSGSWQLGYISLHSSSIILTGNSFDNCSAHTESDSFAFASSSHGGAVSFFIGTVCASVFLLRSLLCSGALLNAVSSLQNIFNRTISLHHSAVLLRDNSAIHCSVSALHFGEGTHYRSSGALGGAFGIYIGAASHATSSERLSSLISGSIHSRNISFSFERNTISSCFAFLNVSGSAEVAAVYGGAIALHVGFFSFSQVIILFHAFINEFIVSV